MGTAEAVANRRERLLEAMISTSDRRLGTPEEAVRQFAGGFVRVLESSARGDHSARDLYLSSVIPALRGGPLAFEAILGCMVRVTAAAACVLGPEHVQWVAEFCADYTARLLEIWEKAR